MTNPDTRTASEEAAYRIALAVISEYGPWVDLHFGDFRRVARRVVDSLAEVELIANDAPVAAK